MSTNFFQHVHMSRLGLARQDAVRFWSENSRLALRHVDFHHTRLMAFMQIVHAQIYFRVPEHTLPCTSSFCSKSLTSVMSSDLRIRLLLHLYLPSPFARASPGVGVWKYMLHLTVSNICAKFGSWARSARGSSFILRKYWPCPVRETAGIDEWVLVLYLVFLTR
jgi:hypothetical protein